MKSVRDLSGVRMAISPSRNAPLNRQGTPVLGVEGQIFGKLTCVRRVENDHASRACYLFRCQCGVEKVYRLWDVKRTDRPIRSCGCWRKRQEGWAGTPTYKSWKAMLRRYTDPKHDHYEWYGAIGVVVYFEWYEFLKFLRDMGERPKGTTLDRIDASGNYEPGNCRWATGAVQAINRRR